MTWYRAKLVLESVDEYNDSNGYPRERVGNIATVEVTAVSPGSVMAQVVEHVAKLAEWHQDRAVVIDDAPELPWNGSGPTSYTASVHIDGDNPDRLCINVPDDDYSPAEAETIAAVLLRGAREARSGASS